MFVDSISLAIFVHSLSLDLSPEQQSSNKLGTSRGAQPNNSTSPAAPNSTNHQHEAMSPHEEAVTPRGGAIKLPKIIRVGKAEAVASVVGATAETAETAETDIVALEHEALIKR